jgi:FkbM family methyltransferase
VHELLPDELFDLAEKLFVTQEAIAEVIDNSVLVDVTHAGVNMSIRMSKDDDAVKRLGEEGTWSSYDLETLGDEAANTKDMLNMLDIGGNYGVITIAAMKKYWKRLRVVTIEPAPKTFFFLKWNLHINGIPEIHHKDSLDEDQHVPGVIALNRGSADVEGQDLHFCFYKESSMNSKVCDCKRGDDGCVIVPSITIDNMAGMFGIQPIAMVKMDCEGCEFKSLPALAQAHVADRVRRLAGELHLPDQNLEDIACRWNNGRLMSKCQRSKENQENIECAVELNCPKSPGK